MKNQVILLFSLIYCVLWCGHGFAMPGDARADDTQNIKADLVWAQSDGLREEIFLATYNKGKWGKTIAVTDDNADNLHPAVDQTVDGTRWIVWTAIEDGAYSIFARSVKGEQLGEVKMVSRELTGNIYPTVIVDRFDTVWVIWSGHGANDDIFYSRLVAGKWQQPLPLHSANQVPDIQPSVALTDEGMPVVRWRRFIDGSYREIESYWLGRKWSAPRAVQSGDKMRQKQDDRAWEMVLLKSGPLAVEKVQSEFFKIY